LTSEHSSLAACVYVMCHRCADGFSGTHCEVRASDGMVHQFACTAAEAQNKACLNNGSCYATYFTEWEISCR